MKKTYKNQVDIFNFLRFFALFCVIGTHSRGVICTYIPHLEGQFSILAFTPAWTAMGIFFILSGYLLGKGFYKEKYTTDFKGILSFWINRFIRIFPMYFILLLITFLFISPETFFIGRQKLLIPLFTFTFAGYYAHLAFGATWFISTIMQLYFAMPIVYGIIKKWFEKYEKLLFFIIIIVGFSFRIFAYHHKLDWLSQVYEPSWINADYFFAGMLLNSFTQNSLDSKVKKIVRPISLIILLILTAHFMSLSFHNHYTFLRYYAPSCMILIISAIIWSFDFCGKTYSAPLTFKNIVKNPLRIIDYISLISFGMYLYHSYMFSIMPKMISNPEFFPNHLNNGRLLLYVYLPTFICLLIWCSILYFFIEKPINNFRYSFLSKKDIKE